jgi:hypothetical protein
MQEQLQLKSFIESRTDPSISEHIKTVLIKSLQSVSVDIKQRLYRRSNNKFYSKFSKNSSIRDAKDLRSEEKNLCLELLLELGGLTLPRQDCSYTLIPQEKHAFAVFI